ncbi:MAG: dihydrolipoamide acetyltransferase family protein [Candidatus Methylomirabilales bacterium]
MTEIKMPQLGESVVEGTVGKWLKKVGDHVKKYEPLLEVITDKVDVEVPSPAEGILSRILVKEGETVQVGTVLALIGEETPKTETPVEERQAGWVSPAVAKLAAEYGVDLRRVKGTGTGGRITKQDVLRFIEEQAKKEEVIPLTPIRKAIAEHMVRSVRTSPHGTTVMEVDVNRIVQFRERVKEEFQRRYGFKLTYLPFFIQAAAFALRAFPIVNATFTEEGIVLKKRVNIGIAVALEEGLIVPVIKDVDKKDFLTLSQEADDLVRRAREKKLQPDEVREGTFTITDHGIFGSLFATPIINHPQAAILGVGAITKRVVVIDDAIAIRPMVYLSLSFDHRVFDGSVADRFLQKAKENLEAFDLSWWTG